jgi:cation:H+ antiporter
MATPSRDRRDVIQYFNARIADGPNAPASAGRCPTGRATRQLREDHAGMTVLLFALGLGLLVLGANWLVMGASRLAVTFGISPLVIGLTVVAFGTSAPESAVSVQSAVTGRADLAVGNVVGSNIFNVLFVLGASAAIAPLAVSSQVVRLDVPVMVATSVAAVLMAADGLVSRLEAAFLVGTLAAYTAWQVRLSRRESAAVAVEFAHAYGQLSSGPARHLAAVGAGLGLLVLGSRWLVDGAVRFAQVLGVSELVIGLTVVAAGTSLPEAATSMVAARRGERDIAVGNVVGSCIFNILGVLGLSGLLAPAGLPAAPSIATFDGPVMIAVSVACLPIFTSGARIGRWEGALFLAYYAAYAGYLVLDAQAHDALPAYSRVMRAFVLPLTALVLAIIAWRTWRRPPQRPECARG